MGMTKISDLLRRNGLQELVGSLLIESAFAELGDAMGFGYAAGWLADCEVEMWSRAMLLVTLPDRLAGATPAQIEAIEVVISAAVGKVSPGLRVRFLELPEVTQ